MNEARIRKVLEYLGIYRPNHTQRQGSYLMHPCPFAIKTHRRGVDNHPSFGIGIKEGEESFFNCFTCKQKGKLYLLPDMMVKILAGDMAGDKDGILYIMQQELEDFTQAPMRPGVREYTQPPEPLEEAIFSNFFDNAWQNEQARSYLQMRGITEEAVEYCGIGFDDAELKHVPQTRMKPFDKNLSKTLKQVENRIIFPVYGYDKNLYGFTGRTIVENWEEIDQEYTTRNLYTKYPRIKDYYGLKKKWFMLGEVNIKSGKPTLVVEGLIGYASLISNNAHKLFNIVALLGSTMTPQKAKTLIKSATSIYLLLDNDKAGDIGIFGSKENGVTVKGAIDYLKEYCPLFIPEWPNGKSDPDELVYDDVEYLLENTMPYQN